MPNPAHTGTGNDYPLAPPDARATGGLRRETGNEKEQGKEGNPTEDGTSSGIP